VNYVQKQRGVSQRRACKVLNQPRSTQRYEPQQTNKDKGLTQEILTLSREHPRYGYRRITALLRRAGWRVNKKRVHRIWKREGLQIKTKKPKKKAPGHSAHGCARRRSQGRNDVWTYDFAFDTTMDGRALKIMPVVDEFTRQTLSIVVDRKINSDQVRNEILRLIKLHGAPNCIRSDNGSEFIAKKLVAGFKKQDITTLHIAPGSPWENGYCESFIGKLKDELLDREWLGNLTEARILIERQRRHHNEDRPHSSLNYMTPNEFADTLETNRLRPTPDNLENRSD
jgi:transposase InsO family protein